jgi:hypothetical protein
VHFHRLVVGLGQNIFGLVAMVVVDPDNDHWLGLDLAEANRADRWMPVLPKE